MAALATDEQLAACCECPREIYLEDETAFRESFAPATIARWCERRPYGDGQQIMCEGDLRVGTIAPDLNVFLVDAGAAIGRAACRLLADCGSGRVADTATGTLSFTAAEWTTARSISAMARRYLCLDFGSFS